MAHLRSQRDGTWLLIFKPGNVNRNYRNCHLIFPLVEMVTFKEIPVHLRLLSNHDTLPAILRGSSICLWWFRSGWLWEREESQRDSGGKGLACARPEGRAAMLGSGVFVGWLMQLSSHSLTDPAPGRVLREPRWQWEMYLCLVGIDVGNNT